MDRFQFQPIGNRAFEPNFRRSYALSVQPNMSSMAASINSYFAYLTDEVFDPMSPCYAWRHIPSMPKTKVSVPIDDNGATIKFTQFKPSKLSVDSFDDLKVAINRDWHELNYEIWVL